MIDVDIINDQIHGENPFTNTYRDKPCAFIGSQFKVYNIINFSHVIGGLWHQKKGNVMI